MEDPLAETKGRFSAIAAFADHDILFTKQKNNRQVLFIIKLDKIEMVYLMDIRMHT